uniref:Ubiquitin-conjugating enzyme E2 H n=1 Tax=Steinernema glaseri TaxID=37863 RepID=A0A1I8APE2_9BILA
MCMECPVTSSALDKVANELGGYLLRTRLPDTNAVHYGRAEKRRTLVKYMAGEGKLRAATLHVRSADIEARPLVPTTCFRFFSFCHRFVIQINMSSPSSGKRRMDTDVVKLIESKHEVNITGGLNEFTVKFYGPKGTAYEGGVWRVRVDLPEKYPFKSPSIGFVNRIFHPNIDEASGTVCLDVINQAWSALYDLVNIFESFLPQLLTYPNPTDPLNGDAATLFLHKPDEFKRKCREYVEKFASEEALRRMGAEPIAEVKTNDDDSDSSISDFTDDETQGMEL